MRSMLIGLVLLLIALPIAAKESAGGQPSVEDLKQANNPLANMTAVNLHNYYKTDLIDLGNATANTAWLRFVKPVGRWLTRTSLPMIYVPAAGGGTASGTGDLNSFAAYPVTKPGADQTVGVGPLVGVPTTTNESLSSRKYQLGAAAVYFNMKSPQLQFGGLVTYQRSFAGTSATSDTSTLVLQPFGLGIGKVLKVDETVFNLFVEPQFSMFNKGVGSPAFQIFAGINLQFTGKGKAKG